MTFLGLMVLVVYLDWRRVRFFSGNVIDGVQLG